MISQRQSKELQLVVELQNHPFLPEFLQVLKRVQELRLVGVDQTGPATVGRVLFEDFAGTLTELLVKP